MPPNVANINYMGSDAIMWLNASNGHDPLRETLGCVDLAVGDAPRTWRFQTPWDNDRLIGVIRKHAESGCEARLRPVYRITTCRSRSNCRRAISAHCPELSSFR